MNSRVTSYFNGHHVINFYGRLRNNIVINEIIANIMNMRKMILAMPAAATKTPVYPTIAAMIAMAKNIKAQVNIAFSPLLNFLEL